MKAILPLLFLCSSLAQAATIDPRVAKYDSCGRFELYSVNGIMTDSNAAAANLDQLRLHYGNAYQEHLIQYVVAFNQTQGFPKDFWTQPRK